MNKLITSAASIILLSTPSAMSAECNKSMVAGDWLYSGPYGPCYVTLNNNGRTTNAPCRQYEGAPAFTITLKIKVQSSCLTTVDLTAKWAADGEPQNSFVSNDAKMAGDGSSIIGIAINQFEDSGEMMAMYKR